VSVCTTAKRLRSGVEGGSVTLSCRRSSVVFKWSLANGSVMSNAPSNKIEAATFFMFHIRAFAKAKDVPNHTRATRRC
jgi:hypothetical protein